MRATRTGRLRIAGTGFAVLGLVGGLAACSKVTGGSNSSKSGKSSSSATACTYVAKLDAIAAVVANADVHDPDTFKKTLDGAVRDYVTNVRALRAVAPADLSDGLQRVEADVQQYRFDAAGTDRAALDTYAARTCGRNAPTSAPSATGFSTTVATGSTPTSTAPTTSVPAG